MRVDEVEQAMIDYHAGLVYTDEQQDKIRQAVRDFIGPRVDQANKQAEIHKRRLRDLQAEQQKLVQLAYKELVDEDVLPPSRNASRPSAPQPATGLRRRSTRSMTSWRCWKTPWRLSALMFRMPLLLIRRCAAS
jgi:hypothetical protein